jgi:hypothetical protein
MSSLRSGMVLGTACIFAASCSEDRHTGNSSETENTLARVVSVDSLLPSWNHPKRVPTVATLRLDATNFDFSKADSLGSDVDVATEDSAPVPFATVFWDKRAKRARLHVRIDTSLLGSDARFLVRWGRTPRTRSNPTAVWMGIPDSQKLEINSVLVDDFEHGSMRNLLPVPQTWYTGTSDSGKISWFALGAAGAKRTGTALGIAYSANAITGQYALMGTAMGPGIYSLRSLDSLVFLARGNGSFYPSFDHVVSRRGYKARTKVSIDSAWRRVRVRPVDFDTTVDASGNIGWSKIRDSVTNLTFMISGNGELWVDDIRIHGIDRDDLR